MFGGEPNLVSAPKGDLGGSALLATFHGPSHEGRCPDADFFAHAHEDIPKLIEEIRRLKETAWTVEMIVSGFNKIVIEERDELKRENRKLQGVIEQHNLCHDLHGKVNAEDFDKGCQAEQMRIYGRVPARYSTIPTKDGG
jgi:hypothetical protein